MLDMLEDCKKEGKLVWIKPWSTGCPLAKSYFSPLDQFYEGVNLLMNEPSEYLTYNAIQKLHEKDETIKLRKGARQHTVYYYNFQNKKNKETGEDELDDNGNPIKIPYIRFYKVYSIDDVENLKSRMPYQHHEHALDERMKKADLYIKTYCEMNNINVRVVEGGTSAYYDPSTNNITLPDISGYEVPEEYYSTTFHEISHFVDHKLKLIGDEQVEKSNRYSSGELLAEISSNIICNIMGISCEKAENNNIAYIDGWSKRIKAERDSYIATIANKASKAAKEFVSSVELELMKQKVNEIDQIVVGIEHHNQYIHIQINSDNDFDYTIYNYEDGCMKLYDGGVIEVSEDITNLYDALNDILEELNIADKYICPVDIADFEDMLSGDYIDDMEK